LTHDTVLSYRQNIFLDKYPKFDCTKHLPIAIYCTIHVEVENGHSENQLIEHRLKSTNRLLQQLLNIPEKVKNYFLY